MDRPITYYGRSGKCFQVYIPEELNRKLVEIEGPAGHLCLEHGPEQLNGSYIFWCTRPAGHTSMHIAHGADYVCAVWPVQAD